MFWLNIYQITYIDKLIVFPAALEQNLTVSQESLLIFTFQMKVYQS